jgi:integrase
LVPHARPGEERLPFGAGCRDHDLVFATPIGEPLHPNRVSREFTRRLGYFDLPLLSVHELRHTWATIALQRRVYVKVVQHQLGHSTPMITMQTYMRVSPSIADDAVAKIAAEVLPGSP